MAQSRLELRELYYSNELPNIYGRFAVTHEINISFARMKQTTIYVR